MVKVLTKLKITEISSVDKGAGDGVKVVLMKRDAAQGGHYRKPFEGIDFKRFHRRDETTAPTVEVGKTSIRKDGPKMNRADELLDIAKQFGVHRLCKLLVEDGKAHGISEHELTKLIDVEAETTRKAGERPASVFSRYLEAPENLDLRKALQIAKGTRMMDITPVQIGGADVSVDSSRAYNQLVALAEEQRRRAPWQTKEQAFATVFDANPELAAIAHRRPAPTTRYEFPR
jgi:hypothetical protein